MGGTNTLNYCGLTALPSEGGGGGGVRTGGSEIETRARNKLKMTQNYRDKYRNKEPGNRDRSLGQYPGKTWKQGQEPGTGTRNRN